MGMCPKDVYNLLISNFVLLTYDRILALVAWISHWYEEDGLKNDYPYFLHGGERAQYDRELLVCSFRFRQVNKSLVGTQNLAAKLTNELVNQIKVIIVGLLLVGLNLEIP